jgi:aminoglycoside phosphotransferase (APT) family kinase protein
MAHEGQQSLEVQDGAWHDGAFAMFCAHSAPQLGVKPGIRFDVRKFSMGQSNPTFLLSARASSDSGRISKAVVRMKPIGAKIPGAHAVEREYRIMTALHRVGFPVPEPYCLCEDDTVLGAPFYIMEFVEGRIFVDPALPTLTPDERVAVVRSAMATLDKLHCIDPVTAGLDTFGKPTGYYQRQIATLSRISEKQVGSRVL